jgi:lipopolysaccharide transport system ATP-binding protein
VLAVGDAAFQRKCTGKMGDVARQGRTVLFVSHNLGAMQTLCTRGILLRQGNLIEDGTIDHVVNTYLNALNRSAGADPANPERSGDGKILVTAGSILDSTGQATDRLMSGRPATVHLDYRNPGGVPRFHCVITFFNQHGTAVTNFNTYIRNQGLDRAGPTGRVDCHIPRLPLPNGQYRVSAQLSYANVVSDLIPNLLLFEVDSSAFFESGRSPDMTNCAVMVEHQWRHEPETAPQGSELGARAG